MLRKTFIVVGLFCALTVTANGQNTTPKPDQFGISSFEYFKGLSLLVDETAITKLYYVSANGVAKLEMLPQPDGTRNISGGALIEASKIALTKIKDYSTDDKIKAKYADAGNFYSLPSEEDNFTFDAKIFATNYGAILTELQKERQMRICFLGDADETTNYELSLTVEGETHPLKLAEDSCRHIVAAKVSTHFLGTWALDHDDGKKAPVIRVTVKLEPEKGGAKSRTETQSGG